MAETADHDVKVNKMTEKKANASWDGFSSEDADSPATWQLAPRLQARKQEADGEATRDDQSCHQNDEGGES